MMGSPVTLAALAPGAESKATSDASLELEPKPKPGGAGVLRLSCTEDSFVFADGVVPESLSTLEAHPILELSDSTEYGTGMKG